MSNTNRNMLDSQALDSQALDNQADADPPSFKTSSETSSKTSSKISSKTKKRLSKHPKRGYALYWQFSTYLSLIIILLVSLMSASAQATEATGSGVSISQIILLFVLLAISGFLSGSETSFTAVGQWKIRQLREEGHTAFGLLEKDATRFITTCLIGSNLANIGATALITTIGISIAAVSSLGENLAVGITTGIMTILVLIFGEITPKALAVHNAEAVARFAIRPVYFLSRILYPIGLTFTWISSKVLRLLRMEPVDSPLITESELQLMLRSAEEFDVIEAQEREMIQGVIDLEETVVREVMTPRVDVIAVEHDTSLLEMKDILEERYFSRIPVYEETPDNIKGIFLARKMLNYLNKTDVLENTTVSDSTVMDDPQIVPETVNILEVLRKMRETKNHMAVVVDEYGGTAGIVTFEDLIEEITGEIYDETDLEEDKEIIEIKNNQYRIQGSANLEDVAEELKVLLDDENGDYDTIAGFIIAQLGIIPKIGTKLKHEHIVFTVEEADERRIICVLAEEV